MSLDPLTPFGLDGRVAIVTGASSGLGARFARVLDAAGASVVLAARRAERLETLPGDLRDGYPVPGDLGDPDRRVALLEATIARYGRVGVVINNAGTDHLEPAVDQPPAHFPRQLA